MGSIMKYLKSGSFSLVIVAAITIPSICYLITKAPVDNLHFLLNVAAGGAVGCVLGWITEAPGTQKEFAILRETVESLEKKNRALKKLLGDELAENRSDDSGPVVVVTPTENNPPLEGKTGRWWKIWPVPSPPSIPIEEAETDAGQSPSLGSRKSIERSG